MTSTSQQKIIIDKDCECGCGQNPNLRLIVLHQMELDSDYRKYYDDQIGGYYNIADESTRKVIDSIFTRLTGWEMPTLLSAVGIDVDEPQKNIDYKKLYEDSLKDRRAVESHLFQVLDELKELKEKVRSLEDESSDSSDSDEEPTHCDKCGDDGVECFDSCSDCGKNLCFDCKTPLVSVDCGVLCYCDDHSCKCGHCGNSKTGEGVQAYYECSYGDCCDISCDSCNTEKGTDNFCPTHCDDGSDEAKQSDDGCFCECGEHNVSPSDMWSSITEFDGCCDCFECTSIKDIAEAYEMSIKDVEKILEEKKKCDYCCNNDGISRCSGCDYTLCSGCFGSGKGRTCWSDTLLCQLCDKRDNESDCDSDDEECNICGRVTDQTTPPCSVCKAIMCDRCGHFQHGYDSEEDPDDEDAPWYCPQHFPE